jgi:hypothetical protein
MIWSRAMRGTSALPARFAALRRFRGVGGDGPRRCHFQIDPRSTETTIVCNVYYVGLDGRLILALEGLESNCSRGLNRLAAPGIR